MKMEVYINKSPKNHQRSAEITVKFPELPEFITPINFNVNKNSNELRGAVGIPLNEEIRGLIEEIVIDTWNLWNTDTAAFLIEVDQTGADAGKPYQRISLDSGGKEPTGKTKKYLKNAKQLIDLCKDLKAQKNKEDESNLLVKQDEYYADMAVDTEAPATSKAPAPTRGRRK